MVAHFTLSEGIECLSDTHQMDGIYQPEISLSVAYTAANKHNAHTHTSTQTQPIKLR